MGEPTLWREFKNLIAKWKASTRSPVYQLAAYDCANELEEILRLTHTPESGQ